VAASAAQIRDALEALSAERGDWASVGFALDLLEASLGALQASVTAERGGGDLAAGSSDRASGMEVAVRVEDVEPSLARRPADPAASSKQAGLPAAAVEAEGGTPTGLGGDGAGDVGRAGAARPSPGASLPTRSPASSAPPIGVDDARSAESNRAERGGSLGLEGALADRGWDDECVEALESVRVATWIDLALLAPLGTERVTPLVGAGRQLPETTCALHGRMRGRWTRVGPDGAMVSGATLTGSEEVAVRFARGLRASERLRSASLAGDRPPKVTLIGEVAHDGVFEARTFASAVHGVALAHTWSEEPVVQDAIEEARFRAWSAIPSLSEGVPVGPRVASVPLATALLASMELGGVAGPERRRLSSLELHLGELALAWPRFRQGERATPPALSLAAAGEAARMGWIALQTPDAAFAMDALVRDLMGPWPMRRVLCGARPAQTEQVAWWAILVAAASRVPVWVSVGDALGAVLRADRWGDRLRGLGLRLVLFDGGPVAERVEAWRRGDVHVMVSAGPPPTEAEPRRPALRVILDGRATDGSDVDTWGPRHDRLFVLRGEASVASLRTAWAGWDALGLEPPKREPSARCFEDASRGAAYDAAAAAVRAGATVVVAFPMTRAGRDLFSLDETAALAQRLASTVFAEVDVDVLHAEASPESLRRVVERFQAGASRVVVTTMPLEVLGPTGRPTHVVVEFADRLDDERLLAWREMTCGGGGLTLIVGEPVRSWGVPRLHALAEGAPASAIRSFAPDTAPPVSPLRTALVDASLDVDLLIEARQAAHRTLARDPGLRTPESQRWVAVAAARWPWMSSEPCPLPAGKATPRRRRRRRKP
jgi:hypothetical protein